MADKSLKTAKLQGGFSFNDSNEPIQISSDLNNIPDTPPSTPRNGNVYFAPLTKELFIRHEGQWVRIQTEESIVQYDLVIGENSNIVTWNQASQRLDVNDENYYVTVGIVTLNGTVLRPDDNYEIGGGGNHIEFKDLDITTGDVLTVSGVNDTDAVSGGGSLDTDFDLQQKNVLEYESSYSIENGAIAEQIRLSGSGSFSDSETVNEILEIILDSEWEARQINGQAAAAGSVKLSVKLEDTDTQRNLTRIPLPYEEMLNSGLTTYRYWWDTDGNAANTEYTLAELTALLTPGNKQVNGLDHRVVFNDSETFNADTYSRFEAFPAGVNHVAGTVLNAIGSSLISVDIDAAVRVLNTASYVSDGTVSRQREVFETTMRWFDTDGMTTEAVTEFNVSDTDNEKFITLFNVDTDFLSLPGIVQGSAHGGADIRPHIQVTGDGDSELTFSWPDGWQMISVSMRGAHNGISLSADPVILDTSVNATPGDTDTSQSFWSTQKLTTVDPGQYYKDTEYLTYQFTLPHVDTDDLYIEFPDNTNAKAAVQLMDSEFRSHYDFTDAHITTDSDSDGNWILRVDTLQDTDIEDTSIVVTHDGNSTNVLFDNSSATSLDITDGFSGHPATTVTVGNFTYTAGHGGNDSELFAALASANITGWTVTPDTDTDNAVILTANVAGHRETESVPARPAFTVNHGTGNGTFEFDPYAVLREGADTEWNAPSSRFFAELIDRPVPEGINSPGKSGEMAIGETNGTYYLYLCVADNVWHRTQFNEWSN